MGDIVEKHRKLAAEYEHNMAYAYDRIMDDGSHANPNAERARQSAIAHREAAAEIERIRERHDDLIEAMQKIVSWSEAYPIDIFPKPDLKKARELLAAGGITIDAISAHCMRHVVSGVGEIARAALNSQNDGGGA